MCVYVLVRPAHAQRSKSSVPHYASFVDVMSSLARSKIVEKDFKNPLKDVRATA